jgi:hypothetical protein
VDSRTVRLVLEGLRAGYVHELHYEGVRAASGEVPLHDRAYYTLVESPAVEAAPAASDAAPGR